MLAMPTYLYLKQFLLILFAISYAATSLNSQFPIKEATIKDIQTAFYQNKLTSKELTQFYLQQIQKLNPILRAVIEVNPDALEQAEEADRRRAKGKTCDSVKAPSLDGIPILLKDNIATKDKLNTTAGSYALLGSVVPRDAGVVKMLRKAGAIILGKASLTEWAAFRSSAMPNGWCARGGQGKEMIKEYDQNIFLAAEATNGIGPKEKKALATLAKWSKDGFEKVMVEHKLDAVVTPEYLFRTVLAIGGYPGISVPAGYDKVGVPFGICFGGLRGTEPKLIEIAYAFEQATKIRKPPAL